MNELETKLQARIVAGQYAKGEDWQLFVNLQLAIQYLAISLVFVIDEKRTRSLVECRKTAQDGLDSFNDPALCRKRTKRKEAAVSGQRIGTPHAAQLAASCFYGWRQKTQEQVLESHGVCRLPACEAGKIYFSDRWLCGYARRFGDLAELVGLAHA